MHSDSIRVLIIDDQPGIRRLLAEILTEEGYSVITAINGIEGITKAQEMQPHIILVDMKMPGIDGLETLRELKQRNPREKVIMMTAYGELDLVNQARELGSVGYVTKPFDLLRLCSMIKDASKIESTMQLMIS